MARTISPEVAHTRARVAAKSRDHNRAACPETELSDAKRDHRAAVLADYIARSLAAAPPLTDEQRVRLAELLRPVQIGGASA
jgi:hypothetical protein